MNPNPLTSSEPESESETEVGPETSARLFLREVGWQVALKQGSDREFCYMIAPGQDFYHRLYTGELYLHRADEKICLACARRRGLISPAPRHLDNRESLAAKNLDPNSPEYELAPGPDEE